MSERIHYIKKIELPTKDTIVLELGRPLRFDKPSSGLVFDYKAGQYVMLSYRMPNGKMTDKHAFSIASSPTDKGHIKLGIRIGGRFTQGLSKMQPGDEILVSGPYGKFVFNENKHKDLVMIAGGIGITPFLSAINYASAQGLPNKLALLYSNKSLGGTLFYDEIKKFEEINKNLRTLFCVTEKSESVLPDGVINKRITATVMDEFLGRVEGKTFFICGPQVFMDAMRRNLEILGVQKHQIEMEEFSMIQNFKLWPAVKRVSYAFSLSGAMLLVPLYLIFNSSSASAKDGGPVTGSIFSSSSPYNLENIYRISKNAVIQIAQNEIKNKPGDTAAVAGVKISDEPADSEQPEAEPEKIVSKVKSEAAAKKPASVKTVAVKKSVSNSKIASKAVVVLSPKPVTEVSPTILAEQKAKEAAAANKNNTTQAAAPKPVTSASTAHASAASPQPVVTVPTQTTTAVTTPSQATTPAPVPVTSASMAGASSPAPTQPTTASNETPVPIVSEASQAASERAREAAKKLEEIRRHNAEEDDDD